MVLKHKAAAGGTPPVRTGTPVSFNATSANTGSTSMTVPADATLMVCGVGGYFGTVAQFSTGTLTVGGAAMTVVTGGDASGCCWQGSLWYRLSPATGAQTVAWDWAGTGAAAQNTGLYCAWYKGVNLSTPVRSSSCTQQGASPHPTGTLTALTNDLIVAVVVQYNEAEATFTWTSATEVTEFTRMGVSDAALAEALPTGNQTVSATGTPDGDGTICAVSLQPL